MSCVLVSLYRESTSILVRSYGALVHDIYGRLFCGLMNGA